MIVCQKEYTITINAALVPDAYWTMDEVGTATHRVDKVHAVELVPNFQSSMTGGPGFISNAMLYTFWSGNSNFDTGVVADLAIQTGTGFSFWFWFKVDGFVAGYTTAPFLVLYSTGLGFFAWQVTFNPVTGKVDFLVTDNNSNSFNPASFTPTPGTWYFAHAFFNGSKVGYSINNGADVLDATPGAVFAATVGSGFKLAQFWAGGNVGTTAILVDELGMKLSRKLTSAEQTFLYNSGNGKSWPLT